MHWQHSCDLHFTTLDLLTVHMLIKFRCTNETGFDAATGLAIPCEHVNVVPKEKIGRRVRCKGCQEPVKVPAKGWKPASADAGKSAKVKSQRSAKTQSSTKKKTAPKKDPSTKQRPAKNRPAQRAQPIGRDDVMSMEFDNVVQNSSVSQVSNAPRCPECGATLKENGRCSRCRYVEKRYASDGLPLSELKLKTAGCQLWLSKIVGDGVSIKTLAFIFVAMVAIFHLLITLGAIVSGGFTGFGVALFTVASFVVFILILKKVKQIGSDPQATLGILSPFWNLVLYFARRMKWEGYDSNLKDRHVVDLRNAPVTDASLQSVDGLGECSVLDLENSTISDNGLRQLYSLKSLDCLVVKNTDVTQDGVVRLQQARPKLWIWY